MDPYKQGLVTKSVYVKKKEVRGRVVAVLDFAHAKRGLHLITPPSRAVRAGEICELVVTPESDAACDTVVDDVAYLGFAEIISGGIVLAGDEVLYNGKLLGYVAGYDNTHMPNHRNIVIKIEGEKFTGREMGLQLEDEIAFKMK